MHTFMGELSSPESAFMISLKDSSEKLAVFFYSYWASTAFWATVFGVTW